MSFDWNQYLAIASKLNSPKATDAELRCAVSRAYYGAFNLCRIKSSLPKQTHDIHQTLIVHFKEAGGGVKYSIGSYLDDLRKIRNQADYESFAVFTHGQVNVIIQKAVSAVKLLDQIQEDDE